MRVSRLWLAVLAACAALGPMSAIDGAAAPSYVECQAVATAGHDVYCLAVDIPSPEVGPLGPAVSVSRDDGRTWRHAAATGLPATTGWRQVVISGRYSVDHTVFVQDSDAGLFASSDGGDTFTPADPTIARDGDAPTLSPAPAGATTGIGLPLLAGPVAYAGAAPALLYPPTRTPVAGPPATETLVQFLSSAGGLPVQQPIALGVAKSDNSATPPVSLYQCDATLTCTTPLYSFTDKASVVSAHLDANYSRTGGGVTVISAPPYPQSKADPVHLWHSTNAGRAFSRLRSAEQVAIKERGRGARLAVDLETVGKTMVLLVDADFTRALYTSPNGIKWSLASRSRFGEGDLPTASDLYLFSHKLWVLPGGRLLVSGQPKNSFLLNALACSKDLGKHWTPHC